MGRGLRKKIVSEEDEADEEALLQALLEEQNGSDSEDSEPKRKRKRRSGSDSETSGSDSETTDSEDNPEASSEESEHDEPAARNAIRKLKAREVLAELREGDSPQHTAAVAPMPLRPAEPIPLPAGYKIRAALAEHMQPHQISGVKFMFGHITQMRGCILAHCMGLGKTLQALALIDSVLLREPEEDVGAAGEGTDVATALVRTVLVVCPVNVIENWYVEWSKWLGRGANHAVYLLKDAGPNIVKRSRLLTEWQTQGGVLVCGYEQFRNMTSSKKESIHQASIHEALLAPGPDVVICDEVQLNATSQLFKLSLAVCRVMCSATRPLASPKL